MKIFIKLFTVFGFLFFFLFLFHSLSFAADLKVGSDIFLDSTSSAPLNNVYIFGRNITVDVPVENDLVAAGGSVILRGPVTESINAAGGNVTINSSVGNSLRVAGGNIIISGPVKGDITAAGGSITIAQTASISGDLIIAGGQLDVEGPVHGKILANGGDIRINNSVGKSIEGNMGQLTLGSNAHVTGDVRYSSSQKAKIENGAKILGQERYTYVAPQNNSANKRAIGGIATAGSILSLIGSIIYALIFVYMLRRFTTQSVIDMRNHAVVDGLLGFATLILTPIAAFILLFIFLLGLPVLLIYFLLIAAALGITNVFAGDFVLRFFVKDAVLDWRTAVVGPIVLFILHLIPILGWILGFILFLMALGSISRYIYSIGVAQRTPVSHR